MHALTRSNHTYTDIPAHVVCQSLENTIVVITDWHTRAPVLHRPLSIGQSIATFGFHVCPTVAICSISAWYVYLPYCQHPITAFLITMFMNIRLSISLNET